MAAAQDANVLMFGLLKHMTNLVGILTTQLKPNEAATSGSTGVKVVKRLPIKIPPPKAFEEDDDYERVATCLREVENFFGQWPWKKIKRYKRWRVVRRGCVDLVGEVYQGSGDCGK